MNIGILHTVSLGSWDLVTDAIDNAVESINKMGQGVIRILQDETVFDSIKSTISSSNLGAAIKSIALTLVTLFFVIEFLQKSLDLKWVTWENVMMFFLKIVIAKLCVDNADFIMSCIYNGFKSLLTSVSTDLSIIPTGSADETYKYFLSKGDIQKLGTSVNWLDFTPIGLWLLVTIQGLIMKGIMAVTLVIVLSRFMELAIYTFAAPVPLATLGCEGLQDVGKSYLKAYASCCIHAVVIMMVFIAYGALNSALGQTALSGTIPDFVPGFGGLTISNTYEDLFNFGGFMGLIKTFILGGAVMKSEQWAKRICGSM